MKLRATPRGTVARLPGAANATLAVCFLSAVLEGVDLQSVGVVAPRIAQVLHLDRGMMGTVFGVGTLGLLPGATFGGWLADRQGRKRVLILSMLVFGIFSAATATAATLGQLVAIRFLTGIGLGAALPNLIALAAECVPAPHRSRAIGVMYAGMPVGGVLAALVGLAMPAPRDWPAIFYLGGALPILLIPVALRVLPSSPLAAPSVPGAYGDATRPVRTQGPMPFHKTLFADGRLANTLLLWVSFFFTVLVIYLFLNWLPSLLIERGLSPGGAGVIQVLFNAGGAAGILACGVLLDRQAGWRTVTMVYAGICVSLAVLIEATGLPSLRLAGFVMGFFLLGAQLVLYALAPRFYGTSIRGSGVGAAVAIGRLGAAAGPAAAGAILARGLGPGTVLIAVLPCMVLAGLAAAILAVRPNGGP